MAMIETPPPPEAIDSGLKHMYGGVESSANSAASVPVPAAAPMAPARDLRASNSDPSDAFKPYAYGPKRPPRQRSTSREPAASPYDDSTPGCTTTVGNGG